MPTRIVKVGGSLLDWPELPAALTAWLNNQSTACNVLIAGGGELAEFVRRADRSFSLSQETSHWLCVDAMSINARLLAAILPATRLVMTFVDLLTEIRQGSNGTIICDAREFLRDDERQAPGRPLPRDWSVSSDSIAARVSHAVAADELVLLKSSDPPAASLAELAEAGYVDSHFAIVDWGHLSLRFVNLRANPDSSALALRLGGKLR